MSGDQSAHRNIIPHGSLFFFFVAGGGGGRRKIIEPYKRISISIFVECVTCLLAYDGIGVITSPDTLKSYVEKEFNLDIRGFSEYAAISLDKIDKETVWV